MKIEKVNDFWVPSNDVHIEQWKAGAPFTQNKCLNKFIKYCESQNKKMKTVIDVGAWCGTWSKAIEPFAKKVIAFEPDKVHFECLQRNCTINCTPVNIFRIAIWRNQNVQFSHDLSQIFVPKNYWTGTKSYLRFNAGHPTLKVNSVTYKV